MFAIKLDNIHVRKNNKSSYELFHGTKNEIIKNIKPFGRIAVILDMNCSRKIENKGKFVCFIGIPNNHPKGTFSFYDVDKKSKIMSRKVKWTDMMYKDIYNYHHNKKCILPPITIINKYIDQPINEVIEINDIDDENMEANNNNNPVGVNIENERNNDVRENNNEEIVIDENNENMHR